MKEPSPLVPQGSFEAMARGKSHVRIAFYTIVAVHLLVIGGLLILGCKRDDKEKDLAGEAAPATNDLAATPPFGSDPAVVTPPSIPAPMPDTNLAPPPTIGSTPPPAPSLSTTSATTVPPFPPIVEPLPKPLDTTFEPAAREHVIVKGDTFGSLATKYGVTVKALQAANPGVDATRLRIGQKVKVPAKAATANGATTSSTSSSPDTYVVKSGDNLGKIAAANGTTVREMQRLNNLTTTQIRVGQKLRLPPRSAPAPGGATVPAPVQ
jgi:LysM repeat protein